MNLFFPLHQTSGLLQSNISQLSCFFSRENQRTPIVSIWLLLRVPFFLSSCVPNSGGVGGQRVFLSWSLVLSHQWHLRPLQSVGTLEARDGSRIWTERSRGPTCPARRDERETRCCCRDLCVGWVNTPVGRFPDLTWCGTDLQKKNKKQANKLGTADKCYLFLINVLFYQNLLLLLLFVSTPWVSLLIIKVSAHVSDCFGIYNIKKKLGLSSLNSDRRASYR